MPVRLKNFTAEIICKKCYYGFANRRQAAFLLDIIFIRIFKFVLFLMGFFGLSKE